MLLRQSEVPLYRDPAAAIDERVSDLLARMTLDEKIAQLHAAWLKLSYDGKHEARTVDFAQGDAAKAGLGFTNVLQGDDKIVSVARILFTTDSQRRKNYKDFLLCLCGETL